MMARTLQARHWKLAAAGAVAIAGLSLAWRALGPISPPARTEALDSGADAPERSRDRRSSSRAPVPGAFETQVTPENADEVAEQIARRVERQLDGMQGAQWLSAAQRRALGEETEAILRAYLSGSVERYLTYMRDRGAEHPALEEGLSEQERRDRLSVWRSIMRGYALRPVSLDDVTPRMRWLAGEQVDQVDLGFKAKYQAPQRFGWPGDWTAPVDPSELGLTVIEVVIPVLHHYEKDGVTGPVWWGIMLAWDTDRSRWSIWRMDTYDPRNIGVVVYPIF